MLLAIDQGTTGTTCLVVDEDARDRGPRLPRADAALPGAGARRARRRRDLADASLAAAEAALADAASTRASCARSGSRTSARRRCSGIGATGGRSRRRSSGRTGARPPAAPSFPLELIRERTGLVPDPYFSATKLEWLLEHAGAAGDLAFGTVDSWLAWKLTGEHLTDVTNASRTMLLDLDALAWDDELLALFGVPRSRAPERRLLERRARRGRAARRRRAR